MVSFIKKNLLGSLHEFRNRFINPIQNGQCADSTPKDVRIMKKRAHVLHAMLSRCVQVRKQFFSSLFEFARWSSHQAALFTALAEERLLRAEQVSASKTRVRAGSEGFPTSV